MGMIMDAEQRAVLVSFKADGLKKGLGIHVKM
jgi:hypothetical protein